jgi:hypothetical protein
MRNGKMKNRGMATLLVMLVIMFSVAVRNTNALVEPGVYTNPVPPGYGFIDFEEGIDGQVISSTLSGLIFTTTLGYDWIYSDIRTGYYNARSLTDPSVNFGDYVVNGYICAWLGPNMGQGRIDFVNGTGSYLSVLTSTYSGLCIDAYDSNNNLIATSGWATGNLYSYTFTRLTVQAPNMAYVIVHDTGNYWLIDDLVTDAGGVQRAYTYEKEGLEQLDQHARVQWGNNWCVPTSTGTSLAWFAENGYPNLVPDPDGDGIDEEDKYNVIDQLGNYMNTDPNAGTTLANFEQGLRDYITDAGYGDDFIVQSFGNPTYQQFTDELTAGEDVLLVYNRHMVVGRAVNEMSPPRNVGIMNPWTGSYEDETWDDLSPWYMASVSPVVGSTTYDAKTTYSAILYGYVFVVDGNTYVINATYFNEVYVVDGEVFGVVDGTVYNTTGTVYGLANRTVIIADGTYFPVTGSVYIVNGTYNLVTTATDHDITITGITSTKTVVGEGFASQIDIIVRNMGTEDETNIQITIYANTTVVGVQTISSLSRGSFTTLAFTWNTTGFAKGNYLISASITPVSGETDTDDNVLVAGECVCVSIVGDLDCDRDVDLYDAVGLLVHYGAKAGQPEFNPNFDIDGDGDIDLYDAVALLVHYGEKDP